MSAPLASGRTTRGLRSRGEADIVIPPKDIPISDQRRLHQGARPHFNEQRSFQVQRDLLEQVSAAKLLVHAKSGGKRAQGTAKAVRSLAPASTQPASKRRKRKVPAAMVDFELQGHEGSSADEAVLEASTEGNQSAPAARKKGAVDAGGLLKTKKKAAVSVDAFLLDPSIDDKEYEKRLKRYKALQEIDDDIKAREHSRVLQAKKLELAFAQAKGREKRDELRTRAKANIAEQVAKKKAEAELKREAQRIKSDGKLKEKQDGVKLKEQTLQRDCDLLRNSNAAVHVVHGTPGSAFKADLRAPDKTSQDELATLTSVIAAVMRAQNGGVHVPAASVPAKENETKGGNGRKKKRRIIELLESSSSSSASSSESDSSDSGGDDSESEDSSSDVASDMSVTDAEAFEKWAKKQGGRR